MGMYGNRKELSELIGVNPSMINKHKNNGILENCLSPDGKKYHLEKSMDAIRKSKTKETHNSKKQVAPSTKKIIVENSSNIPKDAKDNELDNEENMQELNILLDGAANNYQKVTMTKEFWLGKINKHKFRELEENLFTKDEVIQIISSAASTFRNSLINLPNNYAVNLAGLEQKDIKDYVADDINRILEDFQRVENRFD